jgi:hypothetical protein
MKNRNLYRALIAGTYDFVIGSLIDSPLPHISEKKSGSRLNYQVEENTIGQCLGLSAKKSYRDDNLIFEGDVGVYIAAGKKNKCIVVWDQRTASFELIRFSDKSSIAFITFKQLEIIGTIHTS